MSKLIVSDYHGAAVSFTDEGWFNATDAAARFRKNPAEWLRLPSTRAYLAGLERKYGKIPYLKTKRGRADGGTWMHPKLGVRFAQWLDVDFAIWCDEQIDRLLRGDQADWRRMRHEAAASYKVMADALQLVRTEAGKESAPYHFMNEAKLVNWALAGHFRGLDRDALSKPELDLLAKLEIRNTVLIATGVEYQERKRKLIAYAEAWKIAHPGTLKLEAV
ncbi:KilA-N domain-containing protein [Achromobacter sp. GD03932]|uniref:KilA-N domain-containing protein n=1 Tax=Achromobacter sp. GD03932 TaxID=2975407 RepID=UPI00244D5734|nr:KilA-N domain-containing protein [Achromobacter sp. GD03932]MDH1299667.1 KilA-N domain-containing protein [Achromobacter sp. GD03932]